MKTLRILRELSSQTNPGPFFYIEKGVETDSTGDDPLSSDLVELYDLLKNSKDDRRHHIVRLIDDTVCSRPIIVESFCVSITS